MASHLRKVALQRAGYRCSFPECHTPVKTDEGATVLEIAHIVPKYLGGENVPDNFIVLCPNHHRQVDLSPDIYDPDRLRTMREDHEAAVATVISNGELKRREAKLPESSRLTLEIAMDFWEKNKRSGDENLWHEFFKANAHILALTLPGHALQLGNKCFVGGKDIFNRGGGVVDFLYTPKSSEGVTLIEIKTPQTKLLGLEYRNRCYSPSSDLCGSLVQALHYKRLALSNLNELVAHLNPRPSSTTVHSAVVVGNKESLGEDRDMKDSFQLFVSALHGVQIITYDDLFAKVSAVLEL